MVTSENSIQTSPESLVVQRLDDSLMASIDSYMENFRESAKTAERFWLKELLFNHQSVAHPRGMGKPDECLIADLADELNTGRDVAR